jgi:hypothetical protein
MDRMVGYRFTVALLLLVLSYAAAQAPQASLPPLVPCEEAAEGKPCVHIVTEMADIVGVWRRYVQHANGMAFTEFREDGTLSIVSSLPGDDRVTGTVRFEDGIAYLAANPDGPAPPECKAPASLELRLVRLGDRPVALGFTRLSEDRCVLRVVDYGMPMIYYSGSGEELAMDFSVGALAQPLVPCPEDGDEAYPCEIVVTRAEDAAGIWKHYVGRPDLQAPGGMGYQRINPDGSFVMADAPENTTAPFRNYPFGTYAFEDGQVWLSVDAPDVPEECQAARQRFRVYRYGAQPVALLVVPLLDRCAPRLQDARLPFIWVGDAD